MSLPNGYGACRPQARIPDKVRPDHKMAADIGACFMACKSQDSHAFSNPVRIRFFRTPISGGLLAFLPRLAFPRKSGTVSPSAMTRAFRSVGCA